MKQKTKDITPQQYADYKGCSLQYITRIIREGKISKLPHVIRLKNISRFYLLEVPEKLTDATFSEDIIRYDKKKSSSR